MKGFLKNNGAKILALLLGIVFLLIFWSYSRVDDRFVMTVDGYRLEKSRGITLGDGSDIIYADVSDDYLTLDVTEESMTLKVNSKADTLMYYKVNDMNPNLHLLNADSDIILDRYGKELTVSLRSLKRIYRKYSNPGLKGLITGDKGTRYIMLKHIVALMPEVDEEFRKSALADDLFQSFVFKNGSKYILGILDRGVTYEDKGYVFEKTVTPVDGIYQIQFFRMSVNAYRKDKPGKTDVEIDGICYAAKPMIITTEWGAGHVTLRPTHSKDKASVEVSFPKGVTYVENLDELVSRAENTSRMISVSQVDNSYPVFNNIYLTAFSDGVVPDFATLSFGKRRKDVRIVDARNDTTQVRRQSFMYPSQQKITVNSHSDSIHLRTAVLDMRYWMSYMVFPAMIYALMLAFGFIAFRSRRSGLVLNVNRVEDFRGYFNMLLTILFAYVLCKIFIAVKLSFTYPYFEKLSGIIITSTGLMLLLITSISFLLNMDIINCRNVYRRRRYTAIDKFVGFFEERTNLSAYLVLVAAYGLCLLSMYLMDNGNHLAMKSSYSHDSITFFTNPLSWPDRVGVNDNHRSVCYTLFLVEGLVLVAVGLRLFNVWSKISAKLADLFHVLDPVKNFFKGTFWGKTNDFQRSFVIFALLLLAASWVPGNYATALISLVVVLALSRMVITYDDLDDQKASHLKHLIGKMLCLAVIFVMAVIPDQGYMVSWIGMLVAVLMFPIMTCRVDFYNATNRTRLKKTIQKYAFVGVVLLTFLLGMRTLISLGTDPDDVSWGRFARRMEMFSSYDETREAGYRYSEADMEFMQIMCHYMQDYSLSKDPLSNESDPLNKSVSTGQSPVVLNDVSAAAAFFGPLGWPAHMIFFLLLVVLVGTVMIFCFAREYTDGGSSYAFRITRHRIVAMLIWAGASVYLYVSYLGSFPYTGRLIPGFGVDSVGEALEICVLLAFMSHIAVTSEKSK